MINIEELKGREYRDFLDELYLDTKNKELFLAKYTRKDCHQILRRLNRGFVLNSHEYTRENYVFNSITKNRAYKHIVFYFMLHYNK